MTQELYSVEYSQYSEDNDMYPWHITPVHQALNDNVKDFLHNTRKLNKWQIVFIGSWEACHARIDELIRAKKGLKEQPC
jgi:hypothetical protein